MAQTKTNRFQNVDMTFLLSKIILMTVSINIISRIHELIFFVAVFICVNSKCEYG